VILTEHGSIEGLRQWQERLHAEQNEAMLVQLEKNRSAAEAWAQQACDADH